MNLDVGEKLGDVYCNKVHEIMMRTGGKELITYLNDAFSIIKHEFTSLVNCCRVPTAVSGARHTVIFYLLLDREQTHLRLFSSLSWVLSCMSTLSSYCFRTTYFGLLINVE